MTRVWLPSGVTGCNTDLDQSWWAARQARVPAGVDVQPTDDGTSLTRADDATTTVTLLLAEPIAGWLPGDRPAERLAALDAWERELLDLATGTTDEVIRLVGVTGPPTHPDELLELAAGRRWPPLDLDAATAHDASTEPLLAPAAAHEGPVAVFVAVLHEMLRAGVRPAGATIAMAAADALASFACATTVPERPAGWSPPTMDEAHALLARTRALVAGLVENGIAVSGCRTALLWPVPATEGRVAAEVAAEVVTQMLRGQLEAPVEWHDDLDRINALDRQVRELENDAARRAQRDAGLADLPGRALLGRLWGARR